VHLPVGVLSFEIHDVGSSPNHAVNVDLLLPAGLSLSSYWVYGRESEDLTYHWYDFLYDDTTGRRGHREWNAKGHADPRRRRSWRR
jgi:hypothetical protein